MATILTKRSNTASSVPVAGNLTNSTGGAELAVNTADKRLFTKDSGGTVVELGTNPSTFSLPNGTANGVPYLNGSKVLTSGSALTFDGTNTFKVVSSSGYLRSENLAGTVAAYVAQDGLYSFGTNLITYAPSGYSHLFYVNASEQMRLTSTGLGIGTSSPSAKLQVAVSSGEIARFSSPNGTASYVLVGRNDSASEGMTLGYNSSTGDCTISSVAAHPLILRTNNTERARIDSSGNLGLGVTPSVGYGKEFSISADTTSGVGGLGVRNLATNSNIVYLTNNAKNTGAFSDAYWTSAAATKYAQIAGQHIFYTAPSGTAGNAISFTQAMTLDASGNLGVGQTNPTAWLVNGIGIGSGSSDWGATIYTGTASTGYLCFADGTTTTDRYRGYMAYSHASDALILATAATERARIDSSGNLLVGTSSATGTPTVGFCLLRDFSAGSASGIAIGHQSGTGGGAVYANFSYNGTGIGSITQNGTTAVAYNTSSDYRLKENIQPMTGALAKVAALKPCTYKWKADGSDGEGFIAHELAEVCPQAVSGEKDAVDAEGNPVYQGIDTSFLVATLTAAIQELKAEVDSLKSEINTLKGI